MGDGFSVRVSRAACETITAREAVGLRRERWVATAAAAQRVARRDKRRHTTRPAEVARPAPVALNPEPTGRVELIELDAVGAARRRRRHGVRGRIDADVVAGVAERAGCDRHPVMRAAGAHRDDVASEGELQGTAAGGGDDAGGCNEDPGAGSEPAERTEERR